MARSAAIRRNTKEKQITLRINLDVRGKPEISTGIPFFNRMLDLVTRHGGFDLNSKATGDLDADSTIRWRTWGMHWERRSLRRLGTGAESSRRDIY